MALSQNKLLDFPSKVYWFNHNYHTIICIKFVLYVQYSTFELKKFSIDY